MTLKVGTNAIYNATYGYDSGSRLASVSSQGVQTEYSRLAGGNRLEYKNVSLNTNPVMAVTYSYNAQGRLSSVASAPESDGVHSVGYQYDAHGRRTQAQRADSSYWNYGYNNRGEVTSGKRYWNGGVPVSGMDFSYDFDDIGNRQLATTNGRQSTYVPNSVNQYTSRAVPALFDLFGLAAAAADVTVNEDAPLVRQQGFFHATVPALNTQQPAFVPVTVEADDEGERVSIEGNRFVPQSPESFRYDADGNLLEDGRWLYTWDGENRLIRMETRPEVIAAGVPGRRLSFTYDYMGRRVGKEAHAWHLNAWQPLHQRFFVYDGWNLIAERRADGSLIRTYTWGEDVSGSMQGAGGIGGLLAIRDHIEDKAFVPAYDGNGNVIALVDAATATTAATYEYDPFGNLLLQAGPYALINPFRFSTKYTDNESGLLYYGYRYYNPDTGRWISRDPIGEQGGINLYAFAQNDGVGSGDLFGLDFIAIGTRAVGGTGWLPNGKAIAINGFNHMSIVYVETKCTLYNAHTFGSFDDIAERISVDGRESFELLSDSNSYHAVLHDYSAIPGNMNPSQMLGFDNIPVPSSIGVSVSVIHRNNFDAARHIVVVSDRHKNEGYTKEKWRSVSSMANSYPYALSSPGYLPERLDQSGHWPRVRYEFSTSATNSNTFIRYLARGIGVNADAIGGGHFGANSPSIPTNSLLPGYIGPVRRK